MKPPSRICPSVESIATLPQRAPKIGLKPSNTGGYKTLLGRASEQPLLSYQC